VAIPYPTGTITVQRETWPPNVFTEVFSMNDLIEDTYYYSNNVFYVRIENTYTAKEATYSYVGKIFSF
jgi:hypothetical protein